MVVSKHGTSAVQRIELLGQDEVVVKISLQSGKHTEPLDLPVPGEREFVVGNIERFNKNYFKTAQENRQQRQSKIYKTNIRSFRKVDIELAIGLSNGMIYFDSTGP
ncbi:MAG: hypothetical protein LRZ87_02785 [Methanocellales archaeon]|nr:hypothetical protein [Methanocellales archaeon]